MDIAGLVHDIQSSAVGEWMRSSLKAMPVVEALHVLAATTVFGTVFVVDLRLLGFPDVKRAFTQLTGQWLEYVRHLQVAYPYLFSLAVRTNPLDPHASINVTE